MHFDPMHFLRVWEVRSLEVRGCKVLDILADRGETFLDLNRVIVGLCLVNFRDSGFR